MKIAPSKIGQLFQDIQVIKQSLELKNMISETQAAAVLNIEEVTLKGYVNKGRVPVDCYTTSPINGERFYYYDKIIGLNKNN